MSNVTISRKLLSQLFDFAESAYGYAPDWANQERGMDEEWTQLNEQVQAILDEPAPAPDPVTYTVYWQGGDDVELEQEGLDETTAADRVHLGNIKWAGSINHWAEGSDGSIIGYVGAPK